MDFTFNGIFEISGFHFDLKIRSGQVCTMKKVEIVNISIFKCEKCLTFDVKKYPQISTFHRLYFKVHIMQIHPGMCGIIVIFFVFFMQKYFQGTTHNDWCQLISFRNLTHFRSCFCQHFFFLFSSSQLLFRVLSLGNSAMEDK